MFFFQTCQKVGYEIQQKKEKKKKFEAKKVIGLLISKSCCDMLLFHKPVEGHTFTFNSRHEGECVYRTDMGMTDGVMPQSSSVVRPPRTELPSSCSLPGLSNLLLKQSKRQHWKTNTGLQGVYSQA